MLTRQAAIITGLLIATLVIAVAVTLLLFSGNDEVTDDDDDVTTSNEFVFGMLMVGPHDDNGWSEAHYEGGIHVQDFLPGTRMVWVDRVNAGDNPDLSMRQVVDDMVQANARLIIANSDDMKAEITTIADDYPDIYFIHISGDGAWTGEATGNLSNMMGKMIYGKMMIGCAAALKTNTGKIAYLGPLINDETRRLAVSSYLGARHCYELRGENPDDLEFVVEWIGFWFFIDGVTLNPTEVANGFYDDGVDVVISGIDTTEAIEVAGMRRAADEEVWAAPYDFIDACDVAPDACIGVPYFNWGPDYVEKIQSILDDNWQQTFEWNPPDWDDLNNLDTTAIGFKIGPALTSDEAAQLREFIDALAAGAQGSGLNLFTGPLNYQDGTVFLEEGEIATDQQIWYMPQLLEGMQGDSE